MNTVYIFGAGASKGGGIPHMNEFIERAQKIKEILIFNTEFEKLESYLFNSGENKNLKYSDKRSNKLDYNLEEVLGCLDMEVYTDNVNPNRPSKNDMSTIIFKTIISHLPAFRERFRERQPDLFQFDKETDLKYVKSINNFIKNLSKDDTIISFNYDVLLDYYLIDDGITIDYCLNPEDFEDNNDTSKIISLLKLHGSINWWYCPECGETNFISFNNFFDKTLPSKEIDIELDDRINEFVSTHEVILCENPKHIKKPNKEVLIIPPTWHENATQSAILKQIWTEASKKLENAEKIIFIGYSFPQSDIKFKYLLLSSLAKNKNNRFCVEVVDPNIQNTAGRYLEIFKNNITFKAMKFEDYFE